MLDKTHEPRDWVRSHAPDSVLIHLVGHCEAPFCGARDALQVVTRQSSDALGVFETRRVVLCCGCAEDE